MNTGMPVPQALFLRDISSLAGSYRDHASYTLARKIQQGAKALSMIGRFSQW